MFYCEFSYVYKHPTSGIYCSTCSSIAKTDCNRKSPKRIYFYTNICCSQYPKGSIMSSLTDVNSSAIDVSCPYYDKCWRYSYTKYLQDNNTYQNNMPLTRQSMFVQGYATMEMTQTTQNAKGKTQFRGLYCENLPQENKTNHCPATLNQNCETCYEHNKQKKKDDHLAESRKKMQDKYPNKTRRGSQPAHIKKAVAKRDKYTCYYCCRHNSLLKTLNIKSHIDHITPLALSGPDIPENMCYTCEICNNDKGAEIWSKGCRENYY